MRSGKVKVSVRKDRAGTRKEGQSWTEGKRRNRIPRNPGGGPGNEGVGPGGR